MKQQLMDSSTPSMSLVRPVMANGYELGIALIAVPVADLHGQHRKSNFAHIHFVSI